MDTIRTSDLTKYYGKMRGIEHIDLTVRGEISLASSDQTVRANPPRSARCLGLSNQAAAQQKYSVWTL